MKLTQHEKDIKNIRRRVPAQAFVISDKWLSQQLKRSVCPITGLWLWLVTLHYPVWPHALESPQPSQPIKTWLSAGHEVQPASGGGGPETSQWAVIVVRSGPRQTVTVCWPPPNKMWNSRSGGDGVALLQCLFTWFAVIGFTVNNWVPTATNMICKLWSDWSHFSQSRTNIITPGELNGIHTWMFFLNPRIFSQVCTKQAYLAHQRAPPGWIIWHQ